MYSQDLRLILELLLLFICLYVFLQIIIKMSRKTYAYEDIPTTEYVYDDSEQFVFAEC